MLDSLHMLQGMIQRKTRLNITTHRDYDNLTDESKKLKDELENLAQYGRLQRFISIERENNPSQSPCTATQLNEPNEPLLSGATRNQVNGVILQI